MVAEKRPSAEEEAAAVTATASGIGAFGWWHVALSAPSVCIAVIVVAAMVVGDAEGAPWQRSLAEVKFRYYLPPMLANSHALVWSSPSALWASLLMRWPPFYSFLAFYTAMTACYWGTGLFFWLLEQRRFGWLEAYKIHVQHNTAGDYTRCLRNLAVNYSIIILPALFPGFPVLWALLEHGADTWPSLGTFVWHLWVCWLGEDVLQYFFHRLLHVPWLYKRVHKLHHEYQVPFALAGTYAHPLEVVFLSVCTFVPALLLRPHLATFLAWIWLRQMDAVLEHCGYDLPNPLHVLPYYGGVRFHDYHHTGFTTNYASRFTYLDRMLGTYRDPPHDYGKARR